MRQGNPGILRRMLATAEKRATKLGPWHPWSGDPALVELFGGNRTSSGVDVTPSTVPSNSAVLCALRVLSESVAMLPLKVYERGESEGRPTKRDALKHPLYMLLHYMPNPEITSFEFREWLQNSLLIYGNGYAEIERDNGGRIIALWPLQAGQMRGVERRDGQLVYRYGLNNGGDVALPEDRMFHIRGFFRQGLLGEALIKLCPEPLGLGIALDEYAARFFENGANFSGVFVHPGQLKAEAEKNLIRSIEEHYTGLSNAHRIMVLQEGMEWKQTGVSPEASQLIQARQFSITQVAQIFNMKPHMLMDLSRATFSNIEQMGLEYVTYSLGAWLARWEQRIYKELLLPSERGRFYAKFNVNALLRGDLKTRYEAYQIGRQNKWLSANDVRELEDQNPLPPEIGDVYENPNTTASPVRDAADKSDGGPNG